jgi:hypothetical protein
MTDVLQVLKERTMCQMAAEYTAANLLPSPPGAQSSTGTVMTSGSLPNLERSRHASGSSCAEEMVWGSGGKEGETGG